MHVVEIFTLIKAQDDSSFANVPFTDEAQLNNSRMCLHRIRAGASLPEHVFFVMEALVANRWQSPVVELAVSALQQVRRVCTPCYFYQKAKRILWSLADSNRNIVIVLLGAPLVEWVLRVLLSLCVLF